jgi:hypothetical protein
MMTLHDQLTVKTRRVVWALLCACVFQAYATDRRRLPSHEELVQSRLRVVEARNQALQSCRTDANGAECYELRMEQAKYLGHYNALQDLIHAGQGDPRPNARHVNEVLYYHADGARENCQDSQYIRDCQEHLIELEKANAYLLLYGQFRSLEEIKSGIDETPQVVMSPLPPRSPASLNCGGRDSLAACIEAQKHLRVVDDLKPKKAR